MEDIDKVKENIEKVNDNFEYDIKLKEIKEEVLKKFGEYRTTLNYLAADAPISILCLPATMEKILSDQGFLRIYDLANLDLVKIKGLSVTRIRHLTTRLDQFFSML